MCSCQSEAQRSWSDLPPEILSSIGKRLETPLAVSSFLSVCKKWRSSLSVPSVAKPKLNPISGILSPLLPLQIPNSANLPFNKRPNESLILVASAVLEVQPINSDPDSKGWLCTVEEREAGKLRLLNPVSRNPLNLKRASNFPDCLSLFKFRVTELAKNYCFKYASDGEVVSDIKVVLCSSFSVTDCTAMVLHGNGILIGVRVRNGQWGYVRKSLITPFINLGSFESRVCAVDGEGNVYDIDPMLMKVSDTTVHGDTLRRTGLKSLRHHVMVSTGEIYLLVWNYEFREESDHARTSTKKEAFEVYKVDRGEQRWACVDNFDCGVLFVSLDWCFFVLHHNGFKSKGKAITYHSSCFRRPTEVRPSSPLFEGHCIRFDFRVTLVELRDSPTVARSFMKDMEDMLWPLPTWFWPDAFSSIGDEEHGQEQPEFCSKHTSTAIDEDLKSDSLEGVDIRYDQLPILRKVWAKYGNILEGSNVHSKYMISSALELLIKVIAILEGSSGRSLTEVLCNDITSMLCDMQHLSLRVEWLIPFVEKAVALHVSKPMIDALSDLDKAIARAKRVKMKFSYCNMDDTLKAMEEQRINLLKKMPVSGPIDLDQCLAKGLL